MSSQARQSPWLTEGEDKRSAVQGMFSEIAPTYDLLNSLMSLRLHKRWRAKAVRLLALTEGQSALDLCCGTGDFLVPLRKAVGRSGQVVGLDFAGPMLNLAKGKAPADLLLGDACLVPFQTASFDAVTVGWGLRNVPSLQQAVSEIARVLRPGGRFVSLDMSRPDGMWGRFSESVCHGIVPILGRLFGKAEAYKYLPKSTLGFASATALAEELQKAGLRDVGFKKMFFGNIVMHWGTRP